jgi:hypothetical protein
MDAFDRLLQLSALASQLFVLSGVPLAIAAGVLFVLTRLRAQPWPFRVQKLATAALVVQLTAAALCVPAALGIARALRFGLRPDPLIASVVLCDTLGGLAAVAAWRYVASHTAPDRLPRVVPEAD